MWAQSLLSPICVVPGVCCSSADQREELAAQMLQAAYAGICKTMAKLTGTPLSSLPALAQRAAQLGLPTDRAQHAHPPGSRAAACSGTAWRR